MSFRHDLRFAARALRRSPAFALVVIVTLALGIGANTAVFSVLQSVVLSPLDYPRPDRLVRLHQGSIDEPESAWYVTALDFRDYRDGLSGVEHLATLYTYRETGADLTGHGAARRIATLPVSSGYFETFGIRPLIGRTFALTDEVLDRRLAIISHGLWQTVFAGNTDIIDRTITLDGAAYQVAGVMPREFRDVIAGDIDAWTPANLTPGGSNSRGNHYLSVIGRLKPGVSVAAAQRELDLISDRLATDYPETNRTRRARLVPLYDDVVGASRTTLFVLMGAAGLVLVVTCVNIASLFLARATKRHRELAIRTALGSTRGRLIRQFLSESLLVAGAGGALGTAVAWGGVRWLFAMSPASIARSGEVGFNPTLLMFALGLTVLIAVVFALIPAWGGGVGRLEQTLREESRGSTGSRASRHAREGLVVAQVALSMVLLVGAGILVRSFERLQRADLGFVETAVQTFEVNLPTSRYASGADRAAFRERFSEQIRALPGVQATGAVSRLPVSGQYHVWGTRRPEQPDNVNWQAVNVRVVDGDYFPAFTIPLIRGRWLTPADRADAPPVALLSEAAVRQSFPNEDPIGRLIRVNRDVWQIVGVVGDVALDHRGAVAPTVYVAHTQFADNRNWNLTHVVRAAGDPAAITSAVRQVLGSIDRDLVLHRVQSMETFMAADIARERFALVLMAGFAGLSLALAIVGIYGVLSYAVTQRIREIGIRMALGAGRGLIRNGFVRRGALLGGLGVAIGLPMALAASGALRTMVFGVTVRDPAIYGLVVVTLIVIAILASVAPALRATRVDPIEALRAE